LAVGDPVETGYCAGGGGPGCGAFLEVAEAVRAFVAAALVGLPDEYIFAAPGSVLG